MSSEFKLQAECFQWHWNNFPNDRGRLFTVNNNAPNAYAGSVMKAMGVVAGVSDMIWLSPTGAVMLEFKAEKGKQSLSQKWWQSVVQEAGYRYEVIRSVEDFQRVVAGVE
ncbi:MAG: VRR-NUC domain-containing protein [Caulobacteraceae bacterium]|nr:VRR-NUC domain-containing protein [Caulobacteraceae bacterium]